MAVLRSNRAQIIWVYQVSHFRFVFALTPGYTRGRFAESSREVMRVAQEEIPARFDNVPLHMGNNELRLGFYGPYLLTGVCLPLLHAVVRQTLLEELGTSRRVRLHLQIGEAIERLAGERIEPQLSARWPA